MSYGVHKDEDGEESGGSESNDPIEKEGALVQDGGGIEDCNGLREETAMEPRSCANEQDGSTATSHGLVLEQHGGRSSHAQ